MPNAPWGRIPNYLEHILKCFGYSSTDFKRLMEASLLRDKVIEDAVEVLTRLTRQALTSILNVIKKLGDKGVKWSIS